MDKDIFKFGDIGQRLGYFRTQKGFSARELSQMIDKNDSYINRIENNKTEIPISVLFEVFSVLNVSPQEFFAENYRTYKSDEELRNLIKGLPQDKKKSLIEFLKK